MNRRIASLATRPTVEENQLSAEFVPAKGKAPGLLKKNGRFGVNYFSRSDLKPPATPGTAGARWCAFIIHFPSRGGQPVSSRLRTLGLTTASTASLGAGRAVGRGEGTPTGNGEQWARNNFEQLPSNDSIICVNLLQFCSPPPLVSLSIPWPDLVLNVATNTTPPHLGSSGIPFIVLSVGCLSPNAERTHASPNPLVGNFAAHPKNK